ncbi:unnamed protein product [Adineta ricciae]|uniref:Uncharacterized protein n=1 Tax=Adineta ricciae TaxID=249248 RepID=A0A815TMS5_ADIRI|nr:unnamed protein product [Adineta ricciae]CAF1667183.1 unnamed protein product [Adineta ricciae]
MDANSPQMKPFEGYPPNNYVSPPPSSPIPLGGQVHYVASPHHQPGAYIVPIAQPYQSPEVSQIRDWLPWSITNMFIGWIIGGILPLIFSLVCRNYKRSNNASSARTMSILALVFNILVTLGGIGGYIALIVSLVLVNRAVQGAISCSYLVYPYRC